MSELFQPGKEFTKLSKKFLNEGRSEIALHYARQAYEESPEELEYSLVLVDALLAHNELEEAVDRLEKLKQLHSTSIDIILRRGLAHAHKNELDAAVDQFRKVLEVNPQEGIAANHLGVTLARLGRIEEAETSYRTAIEVTSDLAEPWYNLANLLRQKGDPEEAEKHYQKAMELKPKSAEIRFQFGLCLQQQRKYAEAEAAYRQALECHPEHADVHNNLGLVLLDQQMPEKALGHLKEAVRLAPNALGFRNNLGLALIDCKQNADAIQLLQESIQKWPADANLLNNLGIAQRNQGFLYEGIQSYRAALKHFPKHVDTLNNLGNALREQGENEEAEVVLRQAIAIKPDFAEAYNNLGIVLQRLNRHADAMKCYDRALELKPLYAEARFNRSLGDLEVGEFVRGWVDYEWRWKMKDQQPPKLDKPAWNGESLDGKRILVYTEQGIGDTLQFLRYLPLLKEKGATVYLECLPKLHRLFHDLAGVDQLATLGGPRPEHDYHVPLMSLPLKLELIEIEQIPRTIPYLLAEPERIERWRKVLAQWPGKKIGIAWQGSKAYRGDKYRSFPLSTFAPLAQKDVHLIALQKGEGSEQMAHSPFKVIDLGSELDQDAAFVDTAAVMMLLDLVITSDTSIVHLAGALGVKTWLATPWDADWRWLRERGDSPWYPTLRLYRQSESGEWKGVFDRMAKDLVDIQPASTQETMVNVSMGELADKMTILEIKTEKLKDPLKLLNVRRELAILQKSWKKAGMDRKTEVQLGLQDLRRINNSLWQIEDDIRICESRQDFGPRFIELARSVYHQNDERARIKRDINDLTGSRLVEEKSYVKTH